jgi:hypothetical protein
VSWRLGLTFYFAVDVKSVVLTMMPPKLFSCVLQFTVNIRFLPLLSPRCCFDVIGAVKNTKLMRNNRKRREGIDPFPQTPHDPAADLVSGENAISNTYQTRGEKSVKERLQTSRQPCGEDAVPFFSDGVSANAHPRHIVMRHHVSKKS